MFSSGTSKHRVVADSKATSDNDREEDDDDDDDDDEQSGVKKKTKSIKEMLRVGSAVLKH